MTQSRFKSRHQLKFRVDPKLKDALERAAKVNNRSLSAEIVHRLSGSTVAHELAELKAAIHDIGFDVRDLMSR